MDAITSGVVRPKFDKTVNSVADNLKNATKTSLAVFSFV
jgi:hypothetical protein